MPKKPEFDGDAAHQYLQNLLPPKVRNLSAPVPPDVGRVAPTIGPAAAQLLTVLIHATRPRCALEIGTCTGYAAIAMARALRNVGGRLSTIEVDPRLAEAARRNLTDAKLNNLVEVITGDANEVLARLDGPFGLILQDGHKPDYVPMLQHLVRLLEPRGLLVTDDVLFPVMNLPQTAKPLQDAVRKYNEALRGHSDLQTSWLPIGDGIALSVKLDTRVPDPS